MNGLITRIMKACKSLLAQKGQGLVEFALILAFCVGIGVAAREAGVTEAISNLLDSGERTEDVTAAIGGPLAADRLNYGKYLAKWGKKTADELAAINNQERITGDQKGLVAIAQNFLGKDAQGVFDQINVFSNSFSANDCPQFLKNNTNKNYAMAKDADGWSNVLVPLSYKNYNNKDKDDAGYIWLEANKNADTIDYMTGAKNADGTKGDGPVAEIYRKPSSDVTSKAGKKLEGSKTKTVSVDRVFYSDEMIAGEDRSVVLQVHYNSETNKVDQVRIAAVLGNGTQATGNNPSAAATGLDLTVIGSTSDLRYIVNN